MDEEREEEEPQLLLLFLGSVTKKTVIPPERLGSHGKNGLEEAENKWALDSLGGSDNGTRGGGVCQAVGDMRVETGDTGQGHL